MTLAVKNSLDLVIDKFKKKFDEGLAFVGYTGSRAAHDPPEEAYANHAEQQRHCQRVNVDHPERALTDLLGVEREVVAYIFGRGKRA